MDLELADLELLLIQFYLHLRFSPFAFHLRHLEDRVVDIVHNLCDLIRRLFLPRTDWLPHIRLSCLVLQGGVHVNVGHQLLVLLLVDIRVLFWGLFHYLVGVALGWVLLRLRDWSYLIRYFLRHLFYRGLRNAEKRKELGEEIRVIKILYKSRSCLLLILGVDYLAKQLS